MPDWAAREAIHDHVEALAEALVLVEIKDLPALADLHDRLLHLLKWAEEAAAPQIAAVAQTAAGIVEDIVLAQVDDPAAALGLVSKGVEAVQQVTRDGREEHEVEFPAALVGDVASSDLTPAAAAGGGEEDEEVAALRDRVRSLNPKDLPALGEVHTALSSLARDLDTIGHEVLAGRTAAAADEIEQIVLGEIEDPEATLRSIAELLTLVAHTPSEQGAPVVQVDETINDLLDDFISRAPALLRGIEQQVLRFEHAGEETPAAAEAKAGLHSFKSEAGMLGLTGPERLCHAMEEALDGDRPVAGFTDAFLAALDWLGKAIEHRAAGQPEPSGLTELIGRCDGSIEPASETTVAAPEPAPEEANLSDAAAFTSGDPGLISEFVTEATDHLEAAEVHLLTLETEPEDEEALNALFRGFHTIKGVAGFLGMKAIGSLAHEAENLLDKARKGELTLEGAAIDVSFEAADMLKGRVNALREALEQGTPPGDEPELPHLLAKIRAAASGQSKKLGEILVESGLASKDKVEDALRRQATGPDGERPKLGEQLVREGAVPARDVAHAIRAQKGAAAPRAPQVKVAEAVKVDSDRLNLLVDAIGELVIAESMVRQSAVLLATGDATLVQKLNLLDKITRELQELGTSLRMVPVRPTFQKMARLVRDLGKKAGKQVDFHMTGEDTELDKTVVDQIGDPLVHMVRNAVDHGIEPTVEERRAAGKPDAGRVDLRAFHKGGNIYIEIQDDGRGLSREAIIAKAVTRGLLREGETPPDSEVFKLIFEPGLSTAKKVTDVSGRGVGMDVVKRNIESLRGQVEIRSELGKGSVFTIKLPLTLAVIDGMLVRVGEERYVVPTLSIVTSVRPTAEQLATMVDKGEMLDVQGQTIPLFRLGRLFDIPGAEADPTNALAVVIEDDGHRAALLADELLGQQQIVIKSLGSAMQGIDGISGAAIMADGRVGLILDVSGLVRLANGGEGAREAAG